MSNTLKLLTLLLTLFWVPAAWAQSGTVTVTITAEEGVVIPEGSILEVELLDVSRAGAPSVVIASERFLSSGYPARVELTYDPAVIDERFTYAVAAEVRSDDRLLMRTTTTYPVLTRGATHEVEVLMEWVATDRPAAAPEGLAGTQWMAFEIGGRMFVGDDAPTIVFGEDGAFALYGGCNRYSGTVEVDGDRIAFPDAMAGTRMACPEPRMALDRDVIEAMESAAGYVRDGQSLALTNAAGVPVIRFRFFD